MGDFGRFWMQTELCGAQVRRCGTELGGDILLHSASLPVFLCNSEDSWLWWLPKSLGKASVVLGEASDVGKLELEKEVMEHHMVPRTTIWVVGTWEAPLWGFPEITRAVGR